MRRSRLRTAVLSGLALAGVVAVGQPTVAGALHTPAGTSRITEVRAAAHDGFDRLVFQFSGALPSHTFVQWSPRITRDGSGEVLPAAGSAFLQIGLSGVTGYTGSHSSTFGALRRSVGLPNLNQVVHGGEFEGMVSFGAALMSRTSYSVSTLTSPSRVVIDIRNDYARTRVPVYFVNNATAETRSVWRYVPAGTPATGALHRTFAGPTVGERSVGVGNVLSSATGFTALSITDAIARVRLVGGCSSGGSTFTIANQLDATLKSLPTVRWVKIYSPSGQTARPSGKSDSIPTCLEP